MRNLVTTTTMIVVTLGFVAMPQTASGQTSTKDPFALSAENLINESDATGSTITCDRSYCAVSDNDSAVHIFAVGRSSGLSKSPIQTVLATTSGTRFGRAIAFGDVSGDGRPDLCVGAPLHTSVKRGRVACYFATPQGPTPFAAEPGFSVIQKRSNRCGTSLVFGDFNRDGWDDLAVGCPAVVGRYGTVFIYAGGTPMSPDFVLKKMRRDIGFGSAMTTGDFNSDGFADLAVGGFRGAQVRVHYGGQGDNGWFTAGTGSADVVLDGPKHFGAALIAADLNGDGNDELVVGAPQHGVHKSKQGSVSVFTGGLLGLAEAADQVLAPIAKAGAKCGSSLGFGDVDGDRFLDLVIGCPGGAQSGLAMGFGPDLRTAGELAARVGQTVATGLFASVAMTHADLDIRADVLAGIPAEGRVLIFATGRTPNGAACAGNDDCDSDACTQGVCCDAPCAGHCESCLAAHTGAADGVCRPVSAGDDPKGNCLAGEACNGAHMCATELLGPCGHDADCVSRNCASGRCKPSVDPLATLDAEQQCNLPIPEPTSPGAQWLGVDGLLDAEPIGTLSLDTSVAANGAFQASVPLEVLPGRRGFQPSLSINYSSGAPDGLLGPGWSVGGLSTIRRLPHRRYVDGVTLPLGEESFGTERYALDGRLLNRIGVCDDCDVGAIEFRLDDSSKERFFLKNVPGVANTYYFERHPGDGRILRYGYTPKARAFGQLWALDLSVDPYNNAMLYEYHNGQPTPFDVVGLVGGDDVAIDALGIGHAVLRPSKIQYTGTYNPDDGTVALGARARTVVFEYADAVGEQPGRTDLPPRFHAGGLISNATVLEEIRVETSDRKAHLRYHLTYASDGSTSHRPLLTEIQKLTLNTSDNGYTAMPATRFEYNPEGATQRDLDAYTVSEPIDFFLGVNDPLAHLEIPMQRAGAYLTPYELHGNQEQHEDGKWNQRTGTTLDLGPQWRQVAGQFVPADLDGDGTMEVAFPLVTYTEDGNTVASVQLVVISATTDGDGWTHAFEIPLTDQAFAGYALANASNHPSSWGGLHQSIGAVTPALIRWAGLARGMKAADLDGDGRDELIIAGARHYHAIRVPEPGGALDVIDTKAATFGNGMSTTYFADVDGDGIVDLGRLSGPQDNPHLWHDGSQGWDDPNDSALGLGLKQFGLSYPRTLGHALPYLRSFDVDHARLHSKRGVQVTWGVLVNAFLMHDPTFIQVPWGGFANQGFVDYDGDGAAEFSSFTVNDAVPGHLTATLQAFPVRDRSYVNAGPQIDMPWSESGALHLADFNGDGYTDLLVSGSSTLSAFLNTGRRWVQKRIDTEGTLLHEFAFPWDWDLDGRHEIVGLKKAADGSLFMVPLELRVNRFSSEGREIRELSLLQPLHPPVFDADANETPLTTNDPRLSWESQESNSAQVAALYERRRFLRPLTIPLDNDLASDVLQWNGKRLQLSRRQSARPDLLTRMTDGLGAITLVDYASTSNPDVHTPLSAGALFHSRFVPQSSPQIVTTEVRRGMVGHDEWLFEAYRYEGGYIDRLLGEVGGYRGSTTTTGVAVSNDAAIPKPSSIHPSQREEARFVTQTEYAMPTWDLAPRTPYYAHEPALSPFRLSMRPTEVTSWVIVDNGQWRLLGREHLRYETRRDRFGSTEVLVPERVTNAYEPYPLDMPASMLVSSTMRTVDYDDFGQPLMELTSRSDSDFSEPGNVADRALISSSAQQIRRHYAAPFDGFVGPTQRWLLGLVEEEIVSRGIVGAPAKSRVRVRRFDTTTGSVESETVGRPRSDGREHRVTTVFELDEHGNHLAVTRHPGGPQDGLVGNARRSEIVFDVDGYFVRCRVNPLGHVTALAPHPVTGFAKASRSPSGQLIYRGHDGHGRSRAKVVLEGDGAIVTRLERHFESPERPIKLRTIRTGAATREEFRDALGRLREVAEEDEHGFEVITLKDVSYHPFFRQSPVLSLGPGIGGADDVVQTTTELDRLGRTVTTIEPDGASRVWEYGPNLVVATDALGNQTRKMYDADGQLVSVTDALGSELRFHYDGFGAMEVTELVSDLHLVSATLRDDTGRVVERVDEMVLPAGVDPRTYVRTASDARRTLTRYSVFGEPQTVTSARGDVIEQTFDVLGRKTERGALTTDGEVELTTWEYDHPRVGLLARTTTHDGIVRSFEYDGFDRLVREVLVVPGAPLLDRRVTYDSAGRVQDTTYPTARPWEGGVERVVTRNQYTAKGHLEAVALVGPEGDEQVLWRAEQWDARGRIRLARRLLAGGGNLPETTDYDRFTNRWLAHSIGNIRHTEVGYDLVGNVSDLGEWGSLPAGGPFEVAADVTHDELHRLTKFEAVGTPINAMVQTYRYDRLGNVLTKPDAGNMTYSTASLPVELRGTLGGASPYAVKLRQDEQGELSAYRYDASGNLTDVHGVVDGQLAAAAARQISWTSFNKPRAISGNASATFGYDASGSRVVEDRDGVRTVTLGSYYELTLDGPETRTRAFVQGPYSKIAVVEFRQDEVESEVRHLFSGRLGSTVLVTDADGQPLRQQVFAPFGGDLLAEGLTREEVCRDGFTGHTHDAQTGLIHMQARDYDPVLGRFMSPDAYVADTADTQAWNRYSYVSNRPTTYTDPSGNVAVSVGALIWAATTTASIAINALVKDPGLRQALNFGLSMVSTAVGWAGAEVPLVGGEQAPMVAGANGQGNRPSAAPRSSETAQHVGAIKPIEAPALEDEYLLDYLFLLVDRAQPKRKRVSGRAKVTTVKVARPDPKLQEAMDGFNESIGFGEKDSEEVVEMQRCWHAERTLQDRVKTVEHQAGQLQTSVREMLVEQRKSGALDSLKGAAPPLGAMRSFDPKSWLKVVGGGIVTGLDSMNPNGKRGSLWSKTQERYRQAGQMREFQRLFR